MDNPPIFNLPSEIVVYIASFIGDDEYIIAFLSACHIYHLLKHHISYHKKVKLRRIIGLWYFDNFTNIYATLEDLKILKRHKELQNKRNICSAMCTMQDFQYDGKKTFPCIHCRTNILNLCDKCQINKICRTSKPITKQSILPFHTTHLELFNFKGRIKTWTRNLTKLRYLTINNGCKIRITKNCIPSTITHLTWCCNQELVPDVLCEGLLVLMVDHYLYAHMFLPSTLKSIHFGKQIDSKIYKGIRTNTLPPSLETLIINCPIYIDSNIIFPETLTKIVFGKYYLEVKSIPAENIAPHVKCITWNDTNKKYLKN
ncbi:MAG: hypothetical protein Satyrvirus38_2 [Satyrvirus sp.]|uniref:Uncharacterized protein n=1 Tax=Satyrvirus sp. TaxID=2487771 RepID=A0A3G5AEX2_9VIRU|nr:MAG: hypothetical protein Satyrvirus38_2 [Satyrvirus sp.]